MAGFDAFQGGGSDPQGWIPRQFRQPQPPQQPGPGQVQAMPSQGFRGWANDMGSRWNAARDQQNQGRAGIMSGFGVQPQAPQPGGSSFQASNADPRAAMASFQQRMTAMPPQNPAAPAPQQAFAINPATGQRTPLPPKPQPQIQAIENPGMRQAWLENLQNFQNQQRFGPQNRYIGM